MRVRFVVSEVLTGLRRNITLNVAMVVTMAIALGLFGVAWLCHQQVNTTKGYWYGKIEVSVFLCGVTSSGGNCSGGAVTTAQRDAIRQTLASLPVVERLYYESQQQAYVRFKQLFADSPDLVRNVTPAALPESFRVKLYNPRESPAVLSAVGSMPGVEQVQDQEQQIAKLIAIFHGFQLVATIVGAASVVAAVLLVGNAVRVAAFSRRRETGIMRLVGATNLYIQLPFLLEGVVAALVGVGLAYGGVELVYRLLFDHVLVRDIPSIHWIGASAVGSTLPMLLGLGVGLSAVASFVTLRRYLRV